MFLDSELFGEQLPHVLGQPFERLDHRLLRLVDRFEVRLRERDEPRESPSPLGEPLVRRGLPLRTSEPKLDLLGRVCEVVRLSGERLDGWEQFELVVPLEIVGRVDVDLFPEALV